MRDLRVVQQHQRHHRYHELPAAHTERWLADPFFDWLIDSIVWVHVDKELTAAPGAPARPLSPGRPRGPCGVESKSQLNQNKVHMANYTTKTGLEDDDR